MSYDNTNTAVIFKNNKKENEKHPDYRGTLNVDGKELEISLWIKEGKNGKFFSGKIQEPYKKEEKELKSFSEKVQDNSGDLPF
jgi:uncharacterized protein (DUF736 family)